MWAALEAASYPLIFFSTLGYASACLILYVHFRAPGLPAILRALLAIVNCGAFLGAWFAAQPNVGTMSIPIGLLSYGGCFTISATAMLLLRRWSIPRNTLLVLTLFVLGALLIGSLVWISQYWLDAMLINDQPLLPVSLIAVGLITLGLGISGRRRAFLLLLIIEATALFLLANLLLLMFLGLVLNA